MRVRLMRAHPLRGEGPNLVLSRALFLCQTAASDTSVSPDWTLYTTYQVTHTHTQCGPHLSKNVPQLYVYLL